MTNEPNGTSDRPIREVTRHLYGCVRQNHVQDVLDVLDALELDFMPVVDDFRSARVVGVMTRSNLEDTLSRKGTHARIAQVTSVTLPTILHDRLSGELADLVDGASACVVVQEEGRLVGIYAPDGQDSQA